MTLSGERDTTGPSEAPVKGWEAYVPQVREYLGYCNWSRAWLGGRGASIDPKYHPTADGAVKMIFHRGDPAEAKKIRRAFRELADDPDGDA